MTIVRCPRCRDEVTVPARASGRALVRCPLCLEEYLLAEALANAPPLLVIIGGEVEQAAIDSTATGNEYQLAVSSFSPGSLASSAATATPAMMPRPSVRATPRPRRKETSGLVLLVNYIVGGVMGLALGLLILWWAFGRDPLELGPRVARYAPRIVPQQFHGKAGLDSSSTPLPKSPSTSPVHNGAQSARATASSDSDGNRSGKRGGKKPTAAEPSESGAQPQTLPNLDEPGKLPETTSTPAGDAPHSNDRGSANQPNRDNRLPPMPDLKDLLPSGSFSNAAPEADDAQRATAREFAKLVAAATAALDRYERIPKEDNEAVRRAFIDLHAAVGQAGRAISFLRPADFEQTGSVGKLKVLLEALAGATGTSRVRPIKFLTAQQWPALVSGQGLLAAGTVKEFKSVGSLFEATLEASTRDVVVMLPLASLRDLQDLCKVGDELIVVGRVIDAPKQNLPGYDGDQPRVLGVGFAVRAPKPE